MKFIRYFVSSGRVILHGAAIMLCIILSTATLSAQNQTITFSEKQMPLSAAFAEIEAQTSLTVAYNARTVDVSRQVSTGVSGRPLSEALAHILRGTGSTYKIQGSQIIIVPEAESLTAAVPAPLHYTGVVTDSSGAPVAGATVMVKGTSSGTITDARGRFSLTAPQGGTLQVSFVGFEPRDITLGGNTSLTVAMSEDAEMLDEVVVIGYGVQNKRDVSTAISSVRSEQIAGTSMTDFRNALAGKMPGVQVIQPGGDPEGSVSVKVRGVSTITAGSEPLYIVDGVPMSRGFGNLNTNDIESVDVLKDASSAAIYGSRGSNGVILITTKKGRSEKLSVQYDGYYGVQQVSKKIAMMNAYQFAQAAKDGHDNAYLDANPGGSPDDPNSVRPNSWERIPPELFPYLEGEAGLTDTDWQDAIFRAASVTSQNVSFSGKGKNVNYFVSGNYYLKEGIIINSDFRRYSARLNLDAKYNKFNFSVNFAPSYSKSNRVDASGAGGVVQSALMMPPVWPVYNPDGSYNYQGNGYWRIGTDYQHNPVINPVAMAMLPDDVVDRMALVGKFNAGYEFIDGLSYNFSIGGDFYGAHNDTYRPSALPLLGHTYYDKPSNPSGKSSSGFYFNWLVENTITYKATFGDAHNLDAVLMQSAQMETYKGNEVKATDYPNDYVQTISGGVVTEGKSEITQWSLASYMARVQYNYKGKYFVSAAIRADGSSRFGRNHRWGYFPSASAAWRISDEGFFRNSGRMDFVDDLKLRASYGVTGNFNIGNYDHLSTIGREDYILGTGDGKQAIGYKPNKAENAGLRWETNHMANVGLDLTLWRGLLGVSVDYYNTNTRDMLLTVPVPHLAGYSTALMNIGRVRNRGWEIMLTSNHSFAGGFDMSLTANWARNVNEVLATTPDNTPLIYSGGVEHAYYITQVGGRIGDYYGLVQDGIFATAGEMNKYPHFSNTRVGDFRFVDVNGDGVLDTENDRAVLGNYMPDFTAGFSASLGWKGIDLSFNFQGVYGSEILNLNQRYINNMEGNTNGMLEGLDRWRSESEPGNGQVNRGNRKATGYNGRTSTWHIEDGSYLRLQELTLGYTLPRRWTRRAFIEKLRVYASGQNLWTLTGYSGYNPEVSMRPDKNITPGEDYGTYPLTRTWLVGLNITF